MTWRRRTDTPTFHEMDHQFVLLEAIQQLLDEMDATGLTAGQKQRLRDALRIEWSNVGEPRQLVAEQTFVIRGVVRDANRNQGVSDYEQSFLTDDSPDIYILYPISMELYLRNELKEGSFAGGLSNKARTNRIREGFRLPPDSTNSRPGDAIHPHHFRGSPRRLLPVPPGSRVCPAHRFFRRLARRSRECLR